jgi:hypothetical protein
VARLDTYPYFIPGIFSEVGFGFTWGLSRCWSYEGETRWMEFRSVHFISTRHTSVGSLDVWTTFTCMNFSIN